MTRDKPTEAEFKTFWSVFQAKQQRKRDQLNQLPIDQKTNQPSNTAKNSKE